MPVFMHYTMAFWIGFHIVILFVLFLDLFILSKKKSVETLGSALLWSGCWIVLSLLFNLFIYFASGSEDALLFFTGYVIEKSLSIDNIFVFLLIFSSLHIDINQQRRILYWGILGALVFRIGLIWLGVSVLTKYHFMYYLFGGVLAFTGIRLFFDSKPSPGITSNPMYILCKRFLPISTDPSDTGFIVRKQGRLYLTTACLALILIETADIVFALDSIPAILAITTNPFIVYTSNVFAILGLRSLYFVLCYYQQRLSSVGYGLGALLFFVGIKMCLAPFYQVSVGMSLLIISLILACTVCASLYSSRKKKG